MVREDSEQFIPLTEVPEHLPIRRKGKKIHISTVWRWASKGVGGRKLQTWRVGGTTCTTPSAIDEFIRGDELKRPQRDSDRLDQDGW